MGLFRKLIVMGGIIAALPSQPNTGTVASVAQGNPVSWEYFSAAAETFADFNGFCDRKPQVCVAAQSLAGVLESKAKYSVKLVYQWANESTGEQPRKLKLPANLANVDTIRTSSFKTAVASVASSTSTLKIEDLVPEWHGSLTAEKG